MYCIFAAESVKKMNGLRGKMTSQAGHAFLHSYWDAKKPYAGPWWDLNSSIPHTPQILSCQREYAMCLVKNAQAREYEASDKSYKISLVVDTVEDLVALQNKYKYICGTSLVTDAGLTVFNGEPTTTCLGIGPISEEHIWDDLSSLKLFV